MKDAATPLFYVPTSKRFFEFHMKTSLGKKCPGQKRLDRLSALYEMVRREPIPFTGIGCQIIRDGIEAYQKSSDDVITRDFRLLREAHLVFMCGEKPSVAMQFFAELFN